MSIGTDAIILLFIVTLRWNMKSGCCVAEITPGAIKRLPALWMDAISQAGHLTCFGGGRSHHLQFAKTDVMEKCGVSSHWDATWLAQVQSAILPPFSFLKHSMAS